MGGIIYFYLLLVKFSFALDFEIRNVETDLTAFASGNCATRSLNDGMGSFLSRVPYPPFASSRKNLFPWFLGGGKDVVNCTCAD